MAQQREIHLIRNIEKTLNEISIKDKERVLTLEEQMFVLYRKTFILGYIKLYKAIVSEPNIFVKEFMMRTIVEMGEEDSFILFNPQVSVSDRRLFIVYNLLVDYEYLEEAIKKDFIQWFNSLFISSKHIFSHFQYRAILEYGKIVQTHSRPDRYQKMIKQLRKLIDKKRNEIIQKEQTKHNDHVLINEKINEYSHLLHGNPFLILNKNEKKEDLTINNILDMVTEYVLANLISYNKFYGTKKNI